ncbi:hypothetical protein, partial [Escherichia coli]|uniref:hypothetical protein n=1 Tax=Escherichia coli TaxID=562 RepID=UPI001952AB51
RKLAEALLTGGTTPRVIPVHECDDVVPVLIEPTIRVAGIIVMRRRELSEEDASEGQSLLLGQPCWSLP